MYPPTFPAATSDLDNLIRSCEVVQLRATCDPCALAPKPKTASPTRSAATAGFAEAAGKPGDLRAILSAATSRS
jgi:hypothetical protein